MRDDHLDRGHKKQEPSTELSPVEPQDEAESLIVDLVQAGDLEAAIRILKFRKGLNLLKHDCLNQLRRAVVISGTLDQLVCLWNLAVDLRIAPNFKNLATLAIDNNMPAKLEYLLSQCLKLTLPTYPCIIDNVVKSESMEMVDPWKKITKARFQAFKGDKLAQSLGRLSFDNFISFSSIEPRHEHLILQIWKDLDVTDLFEESVLNEALVRIAKGCCSVKLAKFWIDAGVPVDHRRQGNSYTPLHHAAGKDTVEAAHLLRFLLQCGANPEGAKWKKKNGTKGDNKRPRDEKGAKGIAKWLGITWDELVAETAGVRDEIAAKEAERRASEERRNRHEHEQKFNEYQTELKLLEQEIKEIKAREPDSSNHAPYYQSQLMLLEQQNKKRLLIGRAEVDGVHLSRVESSSHLDAPKEGELDHALEQ